MVFDVDDGSVVTLFRSDPDPTRRWFRSLGVAPSTSATVPGPVPFRSVPVLIRSRSVPELSSKDGCPVGSSRTRTHKVVSPCTHIDPF